MAAVKSVGPRRSASFDFVVSRHAMGANLWGQCGVMAAAAVIHCNQALIQRVEAWTA